MYAFYVWPESLSTIEPYTVSLMHIEDAAKNFCLGFIVLFPSRKLRSMILAGLLSVLLDVDHAPSLLGFEAPIRPAHSILFILLINACLWLVFRRLDFILITNAAIFSNLTLDVYFFPFFLPLSFQYINLTGHYAFLVWLLPAICFGCFTMMVGSKPTKRGPLKT